MFGSAVSLTTKTRPMGLLREFCGHLVKPGDETVTLFADGRAVEIPVKKTRPEAYLRDGEESEMQH